LANTKETKPNATKANIHLQQEYAIRGSYITEIIIALHIFFQNLM